MWRNRPRCSLCGGTRFAPIPQSYVDTWERVGSPVSAHGWETLNLQSYSCARCGATDRDRLMWLYLSAQLRRGRQDGGPLKLLHIAPSFALQQALASFPRVVKVTCDRFREDVGLRLDMGVMPFPGQTFDAIVCSHVLEHVEDDRGAMAELFRVLDRDGWAVVLVPIARAPVAFDEDGGSDVSAFERWRRFGQDDHVRLYTRHALIDRLQSAGFDVRVLEAGAGFDNRRLRGAALTPTSALYIAEPRGVIG